MHSRPTSFKEEDGEHETGILGWGGGGKASPDEAPIAQLRVLDPAPGFRAASLSFSTASKATIITGMMPRRAPPQPDPTNAVSSSTQILYN